MDDGKDEGAGVRVNLLPSDPGSDSGIEPGLESPETTVDAFDIATRLHALAESTMRGAVLAEILERLPLSEAANLVSTIVRRGRQGGPPFVLALGGLEELLRTERLSYDLIRDMYRELKTGPLGEAAALLLPGHRHQEIVGAPPPKFPEDAT
jgi:hypothetical protein